MSSASPIAPPQALCIIKREFSAITTSSAAKAITLPILAAIPSMYAVVFASLFFIMLYIAIPSNTSPPIQLIRKLTGVSLYSFISAIKSCAVIPYAPISSKMYISATASVAFPCILYHLLFIDAKLESNRLIIYLICGKNF